MHDAMPSELIIRARWADGAFKPVGDHGAKACAGLQPGEACSLQVLRPRSGRSHRHQFAWVAEAWRNLPDSEQDAPWAASPETLRKHALICTGYAHSAAVDAGSAAAAQRMVPLLTSLATSAHGYALVKVSGASVVVWTPESQSVRAMGPKRFQESKDAILAHIAGMLEVDPDVLRSAAAA